MRKSPPTMILDDKAEKKSTAFKRWASKNTEKRRAYMATWRAANRARINSANRVWWAKNRETVKYTETRKAWDKKMRPNLRSYAAKWRGNNRERLRTSARVKFHELMQKPENRLLKNIRNRLHMAVAGKAHERSHDREAVIFLLWLAQRRGIKDFSGYSIDHIVPLIRINLSRSRSCIRANAPENVRWLTRFENTSKGDDRPALSEVREHRKLVIEWRKENSK